MDIDKYLVLIDEKDKTSDVENLNEQASKIDIKFYSNSKIYSYTTKRVKLLKDPMLMDHQN